MYTVRPVTPADRDDWLRLRREFWPDEDVGHDVEIDRFFAGSIHEPLEVLLALNGDNQVIGLAELSIRNYAEHCHSNRVAYLEGWYVIPAMRGKGVGRALVEAAERWGMSQGCSEFASDTEIDNQESAAAHKALGFVETNTIRCFRKDLTSIGRGS